MLLRKTTFRKKLHGGAFFHISASFTAAYGVQAKNTWCTETSWFCLSGAQQSLNTCQDQNTLNALIAVYEI